MTAAPSLTTAGQGGGLWSAQWSRAVDALMAEREHWALWIPVGIGIGVALYFGLPWEPPVWAGPAALAAGVAVTLLGRHRDLVLVLGTAAITIAAGLIAAQLRTNLVAAPVLVRE